MSALSIKDVADIQTRYPEVFKSNPIKRFRPLLVLAIVGLYFVYVWSFFSMTQVLEKANWSIAGNYLADWVSYETRPDIEFEDGYLAVEFPKYDALGLDPKPEWLLSTSAIVDKKIAVKVAAKPAEQTGAKSAVGFLGTLPSGSKDTNDTVDKPGSSAFGFMGSGGTVGTAAKESATTTTYKTVREEAVVSTSFKIGTASFDVALGQVAIENLGEKLVLNIVKDESVSPVGELPAWARQKSEGGKVQIDLGFSGRVEVEDDEVKVRYRYFGWENFLFDANSKFWGRPLTEVVALLFSDERLDPDQSNVSLAWDNILYNGEWQHADVWTKLLQTIVMAFIGTLFASILAFPLAFFAARNITPNTLTNQILKRSFDFLRSVDMLIWALFFTRAFGPGPLAGISAIFFTDTGTFGKLYSEALENIDDKQREGVKSVGANQLLVQRYGVIPQVLPVFVSQSLYFWESNTRSATIIGAVGAGGIGLKLWEAMRTNSDWENVAYMVVLILIVVFLFDNISNAIRSRLIGRKSKA